MSVVKKILGGAAVVVAGGAGYAFWQYNTDPQTRYNIACKKLWHDVLQEAGSSDKVVWGNVTRWDKVGDDQYIIGIRLEGKMGFAVNPGLCDFNAATGEMKLIQPPA
nr:hypothetical protein [uncultured Ruegeria sp.]